LDNLNINSTQDLIILKKTISTLFLMLMLIGLPFGSYYYLKQGLTYRKQIMKDLESKVPFKDSLFTISRSEISFKGKCTLINVSNESAEEMKNIYMQFKEAKGFHLIGQSDPSNFRALFKKQNEEIDKIISQSYSNLDSTSIHKIKIAFPSKSFAIIDSLGNVRRTYANTVEDKKLMISHISALLPYYNDRNK
jgi:hypothetical protein